MIKFEPLLIVKFKIVVNDLMNYLCLILFIDLVNNRKKLKKILLLIDIHWRWGGMKTFPDTVNVKAIKLINIRSRWRTNVFVSRSLSISYQINVAVNVKCLISTQNDEIVSASTVWWKFYSEGVKCENSNFEKMCSLISRKKYENSTLK